MKKVILTLSLALMLVCLFAVSAFAIEVDGVYYDIDKNNLVATVNTENRTSTTEIVTIPSTFTYEGAEYKVTKIANDAFYDNKNVKELRILSEYITQIPTAMIANTYGGALEKIYIDFSNITSIGNAAFNPSNQTNGNGPKANQFYYYDAKAFIERGEDVIITDPDFSNCTSIGAAAFQGANFERLVIPESVYLNNQIFRMSAIKELVIEGENREKIDYYVFECCKNLKKITIESRNLKSISNDVFAGCSAVEEIYIDLSKCTFVGSSAFIFNGSYDGGQTRTQWYNLEGEKVVDLTSVKTFNNSCFASSNLGSAEIVWPTSIESLSDQSFRKCNINQPMLINAAEGKNMSLPYWCFDGNTPTIIVCNEGVTAVSARFSGVTAVFLADSINITDSESSFINGSTLYCKALSEGSLVPSESKCSINYFTSGSIANYGICGFVATVDGTTVGTVSHTTSDSIDNTLCPVGKVTVTQCRLCDYVVYSVDGEEVDKKEHDYSLVGSITYINFYEMGYKTTKCECGAEKANEEATEPAIFEFRGISVSKYADENGNYSITQGYYINDTAYKNYLNSGKTLDFGLVASAKNVTGTQPLKIEEGKIVGINEKVIVSNSAVIAHDYFDIKLTGISTDKNGQELVMCIFLYDGESIIYLSDNAQGKEASTVTINVGE